MKIIQANGDGVADVATSKPNAALPKVLLVDDQPARLLTYEAVLEGVGVCCVRALSGTEAYDWEDGSAENEVDFNTFGGLSMRGCPTSPGISRGW